MGRPLKNKIIKFNPKYTVFKPAGFDLKENKEQVVLKPEEFEALRLANFEWLSMTKGAEEMGISPATFNRLLKSADKKVADALIKGKMIHIYREDTIVVTF